MNIHLCFVIITFGAMAVSCREQPSKPFIAVNLVGYQTDAPKQALLINHDSETFEIVHADRDEVVLKGITGLKKPPDSASGDQVSIIDFSLFGEAGKYYIRTISSDTIRSYPFAIAHDIYRDGLDLSLRSFYFHRCGTKVGNAAEWHYEACHLDDAPFYDDSDSRRDVSGGWHDAGDYNKFTVNTTLSAAMLLYLFELQEDYFTDGQLQIPESGNGKPDLLDEISYALRWLLKMQRSDGAVYHKVSQKWWIGEFLPHNDPAERYLFEISTAATASFTAVSALGARLYGLYDPDFSAELKQASLMGWEFLQTNPVIQPIGGFMNPPDVYGGEYGDSDDRDERLWASIELYRLTGNEILLNYFLNNHALLLRQFQPLSWKNVHSLCLAAFFAARLEEQFPHEHLKLKEAWIDHGDRILHNRKRNNYQNLIRHTEYYWGSNSVGLAYAFDLIQLHMLTGKKMYYNAALDQLHFILGRNPVNLSQITGAGSRSVHHPYHQLSEMGNFGVPVAGMLVGGPNNHVLLRNRIISAYPAKNYEDSFKNYYVNEPAINFTAIFSYVIGYYVIHEP